jgi:DNA-binding transcriptional regulator YbjK
MTSARRGGSQERSRERREQLLQAAVQLISEGGVRAVTHRAVSARADLPAPAAGYYFSTVAELIEQALQHYVRNRVVELTTSLEAATRSVATLEDAGDAVARELIVGASRDGLAQYEVYLEAARNPALRSVAAESMAAFERVAASRLRDLGARDPAGAAEAFVALADGFALHRLAFPQTYEHHFELLRTALRGLFLSYFADEDDLRRLAAEVMRPHPGPTA